MKRIITIIITSMMLLGLSCSQDSDPAGARRGRIGTLEVTVKIGKVGELRKALRTVDIEMEALFVELSAEGQSTVLDTLDLYGGNEEKTERKTYAGLVAWENGREVEWTLRVSSADRNGNVIHRGDTSFTIPAGDTVEIRLVLQAAYSMLIANFFPIQESVDRCALSVDGYMIADTIFPQQTLKGDTVMLSFDYLTSGRSHEIELDVYGSIQGERMRLYTGDTIIMVRPGEDAEYMVVLSYVGPVTMSSAATMIVTLGRMGTTMVNGILVKGDTIYVDSSASGNGTGISWENAFTDFGEALESARLGSVLLVARGTYLPDTTDRTASFMLKNRVRVYGGFPSGGGARDSALYRETILSGEIQGDGDSTNNTFTIVKVKGVDASCIMDGLTITRGYSRGVGGSMTVIDGSPSIVNCIFSLNIVRFDPQPGDTELVQMSSTGGALYVENGSPEVRNCVFNRNLCDNEMNGSMGGAIYSSGGQPNLVGSVFSENQCNGSYTGYGSGAVYMSGGTITDCIFNENQSNGDFVTKGTVYVGSGILTGCVFRNNRSLGNNVSSAGAVELGQGSIIRCSFYNNTSISMETFGGAASIHDGTVLNCIFSDNTSGGFIHNGRGGALLVWNGDVIGCTFMRNSCYGDETARGGAVLMIKGNIVNCTFSENSCSTSLAESYGGAVVMEGKGTVVNCTFHRNKNTSLNPEAICRGGAAALLDSSSRNYIYNCIFWGDNSGEGKEIFGLPASVTHCVIQGGYTGPGVVDRIFTDDPLLGTLADNGGPIPTIEIAAESPARDHGVSYVPTIDISVDARGFPRGDGKPDIGAFEVQ